jgi:hypothetical protein
VDRRELLGPVSEDRRDAEAHQLEDLEHFVVAGDRTPWEGRMMVQGREEARTTCSAASLLRP